MRREQQKGARARDPLAHRVAGRGLRLTAQRRVVLDAVRGSDGHPTADEVFRAARVRLPRISLGTIYRTLGVLRDLGLVRELHFGRTEGRYEEETGHHHHAVCSECGRIDDVPAAAFEDLTRRAKAVTSFEVTAHRLEFVGTCPTCRSKSKTTARGGRRAAV